VSKEDRIIELLEELVKWTKVTSIPRVRELLLEILRSPEERIAYHSSDGERTSREVGRMSDVSHMTVANWWKTWIRAGIAESVSVRGGERAKRIFSLDDFGIEVPVIKGATAKKKDVEVEEK